jgi:hypothetical protein
VTGAVLCVNNADARALISVFGALLAAFGFFYTGVRDVVSAGIFKDPKVADEAKTKRERMSNKGAASRARWPMGYLAVSSGAVVAVMLVPVIEALWSLDADEPYSPSKTALAVLGVFWAVLAGYWAFQAVRAWYRHLTWP